MVVLLGIALGWVMGAAFAGVAISLVPYLARERPGLLAHLPAAINFPQVAFLAVGVAFLYWGIVGALLGAFYLLSSVVAPGPGLGSANLAFTLGVVVLALGVGLLLTRSLPWARLHLWGLGLLFGWALPLLAA